MFIDPISGEVRYSSEDNQSSVGGRLFESAVAIGLGGIAYGSMQRSQVNQIRRFNKPSRTMMHPAAEALVGFYHSAQKGSPDYTQIPHAKYLIDSDLNVGLAPGMSGKSTKRKITSVLTQDKKIPHTKASREARQELLSEIRRLLNGMNATVREITGGEDIADVLQIEHNGRSFQVKLPVIGKMNFVHHHGMDKVFVGGALRAGDLNFQEFISPHGIISEAIASESERLSTALQTGQDSKFQKVFHEAVDRVMQLYTIDTSRESELGVWSSIQKVKMRDITREMRRDIPSAMRQVKRNVNQMLLALTEQAPITGSYVDVRSSMDALLQETENVMGEARGSLKARMMLTNSVLSSFFDLRQKRGNIRIGPKLLELLTDEYSKFKGTVNVFFKSRNSAFAQISDPLTDTSSKFGTHTAKLALDPGSINYTSILKGFIGFSHIFDNYVERGAKRRQPVNIFPSYVDQVRMARGENVPVSRRGFVTDTARDVLHEIKNTFDVSSTGYQATVYFRQSRETHGGMGIVFHGGMLDRPSEGGALMDSLFAEHMTGVYKDRIKIKDTVLMGVNKLDDNRIGARLNRFHQRLNPKSGKKEWLNVQDMVNYNRTVNPDKMISIDPDAIIYYGGPDGNTPVRLRNIKPKVGPDEQWTPRALRRAEDGSIIVEGDVRTPFTNNSKIAELKVVINNQLGRAVVKENYGQRVHDIVNQNEVDLMTEMSLVTKNKFNVNEAILNRAMQVVREATRSMDPVRSKQAIGRTIEVMMGLDKGGLKHFLKNRSIESSIEFLQGDRVQVHLKGGTHEYGVFMSSLRTNSFIQKATSDKGASVHVLADTGMARLGQLENVLKTEFGIKDSFSFVASIQAEPTNPDVAGMKGMIFETKATKIRVDKDGRFSSTGTEFRSAQMIQGAVLNPFLSALNKPAGEWYRPGGFREYRSGHFSKGVRLDELTTQHLRTTGHVDFTRWLEGNRAIAGQEGREMYGVIDHAIKSVTNRLPGMMKSMKIFADKEGIPAWIRYRFEIDEVPDRRMSHMKRIYRHIRSIDSVRAKQPVLMDEVELKSFIAHLDDAQKYGGVVDMGREVMSRLVDSQDPSRNLYMRHIKTPGRLTDSHYRHQPITELTFDNGVYRPQVASKRFLITDERFASYARLIRGIYDFDVEKGQIAAGMNDVMVNSELSEKMSRYFSSVWKRSVAKPGYINQRIVTTTAPGIQGVAMGAVGPFAESLAKEMGAHDIMIDEGTFRESLLGKGKAKFKNAMYFTIGEMNHMGFDKDVIREIVQQRSAEHVDMNRGKGQKPVVELPGSGFKKYRLNDKGVEELIRTLKNPNHNVPLMATVARYPTIYTTSTQSMRIRLVDMKQALVQTDSRWKATADQFGVNSLENDQTFMKVYERYRKQIFVNMYAQKAMFGDWDQDFVEVVHSSLDRMGAMGYDEGLLNVMTKEQADKLGSNTPGIIIREGNMVMNPYRGTIQHHLSGLRQYLIEKGAFHQSGPDGSYMVEMKRVIGQSARTFLQNDFIKQLAPDQPHGVFLQNVKTRTLYQDISDMVSGIQKQLGTHSKGDADNLERELALKYKTIPDNMVDNYLKLVAAAPKFMGDNHDKIVASLVRQSMGDILSRKGVDVLSDDAVLRSARTDFEVFHSFGNLNEMIESATDPNKFTFYRPSERRAMQKQERNNLMKVAAEMRVNDLKDLLAIKTNTGIANRLMKQVVGAVTLAQQTHGPQSVMGGNIIAEDLTNWFTKAIVQESIDSKHGSPIVMEDIFRAFKELSHDHTRHAALTRLKTGDFRMQMAGQDIRDSERAGFQVSKMLDGKAHISEVKAFHDFQSQIYDIAIKKSNEIKESGALMKLGDEMGVLGPDDQVKLRQELEQMQYKGETAHKGRINIDKAMKNLNKIITRVSLGDMSERELQDKMDISKAASAEAASLYTISPNKPGRLAVTGYTGADEMLEAATNASHYLSKIENDPYHKTFKALDAGEIIEPRRVDDLIGSLQRRTDSMHPFGNNLATYMGFQVHKEADSGYSRMQRPMLGDMLAERVGRRLLRDKSQEGPREYAARTRSRIRAGRSGIMGFATGLAGVGIGSYILSGSMGPVSQEQLGRPVSTGFSTRKERTLDEKLEMDAITRAIEESANMISRAPARISIRNPIAEQQQQRIQFEKNMYRSSGS